MQSPSEESCSVDKWYDVESLFHKSSLPPSSSSPSSLYSSHQLHLSSSLSRLNYSDNPVFKLMQQNDTNNKSFNVRSTQDVELTAESPSEILDDKEEDAFGAMFSSGCNKTTENIWIETGNKD